MRHPRTGFSLVELVLVIAIGGIIAMIAIPRMSSAADRAKAASVVGSVTQLQRSVELYTAEHADRTPVTEPNGSTSLSGVALVQRLLQPTDDLGNVGADLYLGPYLRNWPTNNFNGKQSIRIDGAPAGANTHGWRIDSATLLVEADQLVTVSGLGRGGKVTTVVGGGALEAVGR